MKLTMKLPAVIGGILAAGVVMVSGASMAFADTTTTTNTGPITTSGLTLSGTVGSNANANAKGTIASIANTVIDYALFIAGAVAVIFLIFYGFQYVTAGGDAEKVKKARAGIVNAIVGIIVILIAVAIVNFAANIGGGVAKTVNTDNTVNGNGGSQDNGG
jgi:hypothetical protein